MAQLVWIHLPQSRFLGAVPDHLAYPRCCHRRAGLPQLTIHGLRHTHATILLEQGVNPKVVSERLGHASVATTMDIYSHVLPDMQEKAALAIDAALAPK